MKVTRGVNGGSALGTESDPAARLASLMQDALQHHQNGRLTEASRGYLGALDESPGQPDALHLLGTIAYQQGDLDRAIELISEAIEVASDAAAYHSNLGNVLKAAGRIEEAVLSYQRALTLQPDFSDARNNLGNAQIALGHFEQAVETYRVILAQTPDLADAHNNLGIAFKALAQSSEAVACFERAIALRPDYSDALVNFGNALVVLGRSAEAIAAYRRAIECQADDASVHQSLAAALRSDGQQDESIDSYRQALLLRPDDPELYSQLGTVFQQARRTEEARDAFLDALKRSPDHPDALNNLGVAERTLGHFAEAEACFRRASDENPGFFEPLHNLGGVLLDQGKSDEAIDSYRRALEIDPTKSSSYHTLGLTLYAVDRIDEAREVFDKWLEQIPDDPIAAHLARTNQAGDAPERASDAYVRAEFDGFARDFDKKLAQLEYRAPGLLYELFVGDLATDSPALDILDAGCGTGLCGPMLRPHAGRLVGVDLSTGMLAEAEHRDCYDELIEAELTRYLTESASEFDVVLAADTLVYFGALEEVCAAAGSALRPGGQLVFSVEATAADASTPQHTISPNGRYKHSEPYLRRVLEDSGFEIISLKQDTLRREGVTRVQGHLVLARRRH